MKPADNPILFGHRPEPRIVAVEAAANGKIELFQRHDGGSTGAACRDFEPFLWAADLPMDGTWEGQSLSGELDLSFLLRSPDWKSFQQLRQHLSDENIPFFAFPDPTQQFLAASGITLFHELPFAELRRMQLDIETACEPGAEFSNAARPGDHLLAIGLSDQTGWEELLINDSPDPDTGERRLLERLHELIAERDPDVIEGHNIFRFDLPYLTARAKRHRLRLKLGRHGRAVQGRPSRLQIAERNVAYTRYQIYGRHLVDTYLLALHYDVATREVESFGLKELALHFGITRPGERPMVEGAKMRETLDDDPERFKSYLSEDLRETRELAGILSPSFFAQAKMFPLNYQDVILRGNATRIDSLFLREYLRVGHGIPEPPASRSFAGGYTAVFEHGVLGPIGHCDIASLYPSVMLQDRIFPTHDLLGTFETLLRDLRTLRLEAKSRLRQLEKSAPGSTEYHETQSLQQAFKILINSFYGYLGFGQGHFADFDAAERVTARGRELLQGMVAHLKEQDVRVVEIDTDGIYFVIPKDRSMARLQKDLQASLPEGIEVEFDATYQAMFSYKVKNYALLGGDGQLIIKGGALKSRGLERYLREFLREMLRALLEGRAGEVPKIREAYQSRIAERSQPIEWLMKTDTLQDSLAVYQKKIGSSSRGRAAAYEVALRSGRDLQPGDQVRYYITGEKRKVPAHEHARPVDEWDPDRRDENIAYYIGKLDDLVKRFSEFLPTP